MSDEDSSEPLPESKWWQLGQNAAVVINIDRASAMTSGGMIQSVYYLDTYDPNSGERHRFMIGGIYWCGYDMRVKCMQKPVVGEWEPTTAPDEASGIDFDELLRDPETQ